MAKRFLAIRSSSTYSLEVLDMTKPMKYFVGSRLKVQWANRHIKELNSIVNGLVKADLCRLHIETNPNTGQNVLVVDSTAEFPPTIALTIGDIVHNLRSSLDYVTSYVVGKDNDRITFPMHEKRDCLATTAAYRTIQETLPDLADFILNTIQPYKGGDFKTWEVSRLNNVDKHKLLVPALILQGLSGVCAEDDRNHRVIGGELLVGPGGQLRAVGLPGKMKITSYGEPIAQVTFPQGGPFQDQAIVPTLAQCAQLTLKAIEALESFCFGNVPDPNSVKS
jgi:hypothetical protein